MILICFYFPVVSVYGDPGLQTQIPVYLKKTVFATAHTQFRVCMEWEELKQHFRILSYSVYTARAGSEMSMPS